MRKVDCAVQRVNYPGRVIRDEIVSCCSFRVRFLADEGVLGILFLDRLVNECFYFYRE